MIIKRLELQGFKSFPERTRIIFHPGITAIVGPNGTGKSNIIDAILWVLGGQRQKALRGERSEDIIFNGNNKRPPLGMAEVVMTLEDGSEELVISHRLYRSGEGEYRLNGKPVRLKDIQDTLWKREVAEKNYFIIEQGSIGLLLTSKPQEKRQLLEEAAGTAFYKEKKKQAQSKLESSEQNLTRLEDIIAEVGRAKNSLARQAAAAQRYRRLRERIRELRGLLFLKKLNQLEERREEVGAAYNRCLQEEKNLLEKIKASEKEISSLRTSLWEVEKWLGQAREELHGLETRRQRLEGERETRRIEFLQERKRQAQQELGQLEEEGRLINQELLLALAVQEDLERSLQLRLRSWEQARQEMEELEKIKAEISQQLQEGRDEHLRSLSRLTEIKNEAGRLEKEMELSLKQEKKLHQQIEASRQNLSTLELTLDQMEQEIAQWEKERVFREQKIEQLERRLKELILHQEESESRLHEKQKEKDLISYELQALRKVCQQAIAELPADQIPGCPGRLLDLIEVDPGFGRLADLCFGEMARALVLPVEEILSRESYEIKGVFYLLPPAAADRSPSLPQDPEVVGYLKSHLHPNGPMVEKMGRFPETIIVTNLRAAAALWVKYPEFNYATLQGDLLLSSGLLRIGEKSEGVFALKEDLVRLEKELEQKEREIKPVLEELEEIKKSRQRIEVEIQEGKQGLAQVERKIKELEKEKSQLTMEENQLRSNQELFEKELAILLGERQELQAKLRSTWLEVEHLAREEAAVRERVANREKSLMEQEKKSSLQAQRVMELKAALEIEQEKKRHVANQVDALRQRQETIKLKIQEIHTQLEAWEVEEMELRQSLQQVEDQMESLDALVEKKRNQVVEAEARHAAIREREQADEKLLQEQREAYEAKKEERVRWEIARAEVERDLANLEESCWQELRQNLAELRKEAPQKEMFNGEIESELARAEEELHKYKAVNLMAEEEYQQQKERYHFLLQQRNDLRESIQATREAIDKIDEESKNQFLRAMEEVNRHFQEVFSLLFRGGTAEVRLLDPANPLESGVDIMAQPPGKKVQNITLLSGGEKSLTSLAFLFALFRTRPTPFCILDEVDAALDENNISRFLDLMQKIKSETQFIIITHNYKTMEVADYIYGTTMDEPNVTRLYSVRLEKKEAPAVS